MINKIGSGKIISLKRKRIDLELRRRMLCTEKAPTVRREFCAILRPKLCRDRGTGTFHGV